MRSLSLPVLGLALLWSIAGCTKPNPRDCADGSCTDPAFPFCDQAGTFGPPQTCIAVTCTAGDFAACQGDQALACNATGNDYAVTQCEHGCDADAHGCVACLDNTQCANPSPTCDAATHACRACQVDADCTSEVCDDHAGTCVDSASIIYAAPDGSAAGDCGSQATPCAFDRAFTLIDATHHTVKVRAGTYNTSRAFSFTTSTQDELYFDGIGATVVNGGKTALFEVLGSGLLRLKGFTFQPTGLGSNDTVSCGTFNTPFISNLDAEDLNFTDGTEMINVFSCVASLRRIHVAIGAGRAALFIAGGGSMTIEQSLFVPSSSILPAGGIAIFTEKLDGTPHVQLHVSNSVFRDLDDDIVATDGVIDIQFSTFVNLHNPIDCTNDTAGAADAQRTYSNSVFVNTNKQQPVVDSPCTFHYNIMFPQFVVPTHSDNLLFNVDPMLKDIANGDYHLTAGSHAIDAADPAATEMIDYDGAKRPDGILRDLGAFEFHAQ
jgi:hypothetical protein